MPVDLTLVKLYFCRYFMLNTMHSFDGARVKFPLKSLIVLLVGLCHWVRSWWPPGAWWDRDSDVDTSSRIFATRSHQESRRAFWRKTRHGTFHGR